MYIHYLKEALIIQHFYTIFSVFLINTLYIIVKTGIQRGEESMLNNLQYCGPGLDLIWSVRIRSNTSEFQEIKLT